MMRSRTRLISSDDSVRSARAEGHAERDAFAPFLERRPRILADEFHRFEQRTRRRRNARLQLAGKLPQAADHREIERARRIAAHRRIFHCAQPRATRARLRDRDPAPRRVPIPPAPDAVRTAGPPRGRAIPLPPRAQDARRPRARRASPARLASGTRPRASIRTGFATRRRAVRKSRPPDAELPPANPAALLWISSPSSKRRNESLCLAFSRMFFQTPGSSDARISS